MAITFNHNDQIYVKDGKMGIGASDPLRDLHVVGDFSVNASTSQYYGVLINGGESSNPAITIGDWHNSSATIKWDSTNNYLVIDSQHSSSGSSILFTGNDSATEYMRITGAGNVGIGTTSPTAKLHVAGGRIEVDSNSNLPIIRARYNSNYYTDYDSNGINFVGAGQNFDVRDNGTTVLYLKSGGNVGIGTTSPAQLLHIKGTNPILNVETTWATGNYGQIRLGYTGGTDRSITGHYDNGMTFDVNGERMRIDTSGNVGIGTTSPSAKFEVNGDGTNTGGIALREGTNQVHYIYTDGPYQYNLIGSSSPNWRWGQQGGDVKMALNNTGLGIGTTSPAAKLHVDGNVRFVDAGFAGFEAHNTNGNWESFIGTETGGGGNRYNSKSSQHTFYNNSTAVMRINSSGNVGIGTTSPTFKLHLNNSATLTPTYQKFTNGTATTGTTLGIDADGDFLINNGEDKQIKLYTNDTQRLTILSTGNVGIGTTNPAYKLTVVGRVSVENDILHVVSSSPTLLFSVPGGGIDSKIYNDGSGNFIIGHGSNSDNPAEKFRITSAGNVGIGTTNPSEKLEVIGNIKAGAGAADNSVQARHSDNSYTSVHGYGLYMSRASSYIRPTVDNTQALYIGTDSKQWSTISVDASTTAFSTNGSEAMRITSAGNVGIGTTSPTAALHVDIPGNTVAFRATRNGGADGDLELTFGSAIAGYNSKAGGHRWFESSSEKMRLTGGNLGIGTTSPAAKLDVNGVVSLKTGSDSAYSIGVLEITSGGTPTQIKITTAIPFGGTTNAHSVTIKGFQYGSANTANLQISWHVYNNSFYSRTATSSGGWAPTIRLAVENGYVVIHLTSPGYWPKLYVESLYNAYGGTSHAQGWSWADAAINSDTNTPNEVVPYKVDFGNSFAMTSSGNVGIGTTSPSTKLHIDGGSVKVTGNATDQYFLEGVRTGVGTTIRIYDNANTAYIDSYNNMAFRANQNGGSGGTFRFTGGNVGIGTTSPNTFLHIAGQGNRSGGQIYLGNQDDGSTKYSLITSAHYNAATEPEGFTLITGLSTATENTVSIGGFVWESNPATDIRFFTHTATTDTTGGSERMRIISNGNVGIGTTSPSRQLHIAGSTFGAMLISGVASDAFSEYSDGTNVWKAGIDYSQSAYRITHTNFNGAGISLDSGGNLTVDAKGSFSKNYVYGQSNYHIALNEDSGVGYIGNVNGSPYIANASYYGSQIYNVSASQTGLASVYVQSTGDILFLTNTFTAGASSTQTANQRMVVKGNGNVGIGLTAPGQKLSVDGNIQGYGNAYFGASQTSGSTILQLNNYDATLVDSEDVQNVIKMQGRYWSGNSSQLIQTEIRSIKNNTNGNGGSALGFATQTGGDAPAERMRINKDGNVGIGTTSPAGRLELNGSGQNWTTAPAIRMWDSYNSKGWLVGSANNVNAGDFYIRTLPGEDTNPGTSNNEFTIKHATGNVGIGTTSPSRKLHIVDSVWDNSNGGGVIFENSNTVGASLTLKPSASVVTNGANGWALYAGGPGAAIGDGNLGFWAHATNDARMVIQRGGNVGIGTASPGQKLDVSGNVRGNNIYANDSSVPSLYMERGDGNPQAVIRLVKSNDNLLIGNTAIDEVIFYDDAGEAMRLDGAGNLGIGTTGPNQKLHVEGAIYAGTANSTSGSLILVGKYNNGNIITIGGEYSNGGIVIGYGVKPSTTASGAFLSSSALANLERGAYTQVGSEHRWWSGAYQTVAEGGAVTMSRTMTLDGAGNLGIGTTSPAATLHISKGSNNSPTVFRIENVDTTIETAQEVNTIQFYTNDGSTSGTGITSKIVQVAENPGNQYGLSFYTYDLGLAEALRITNDGNVGIGTTTPSYKFTVSSGTADIGILTASSDSGSYVGFLDNATSTIPKVGAVGNKLILDASQYVGVRRTDPSYALDVSGTIRATGDVIAYSDARVKENVETIPNALEKVKAMRGVGYNKIGEQKRSIGVIAQEMLEVMPEVVSQDEQGMYSVAYGNLVGVLVEAMKEQQKQIDELKAQLDVIAS